MRKVLKCAALVLGVALAQPGYAALGTSASYSPKDVALADITDFAPSARSVDNDTAEMCVPPEEQYIPSFVRDPGGRIVGVNYTIIEYVC